MIDTVSLRHPILLLPPSEMTARGFVTKCGHQPSGCEHQKWVLNHPQSMESAPRITWSSSRGEDWLTAEVSVPKFLFRRNVVHLTDADIICGLDEISRFVSIAVGVPFDAPSALVGRVDYCHNFTVGAGNTIPYISAAAHASLPRMTRHQIGDTSLAFKHGSQKILLYSKYDEVTHRAKKGRVTSDELRESVGLLRLEISHFNSDACRRLSKRYSLPDRSASLLLHSSIAHQEIERGLGLLGLDRITETVDARVDTLRDCYGDSPQTRRLVGFLGFLDCYGEGFWRGGIGGYRRSAYYQNCRELKNAGVWLKSDCQLSPLSLVGYPHKQSSRAPQPMSNTNSCNPAQQDSSQRLYEWNGAT